MQIQYIMRVNQINQLNEAIIVLRHFIDLSAQLLPFLDELNRIKHPTKTESINRERIINVYYNHKFDTNTSKTLLHSNILELIKESFESLLKNKRGVNKSLQSFINEHDRLSQNWLKIDSN